MKILYKYKYTLFLIILFSCVNNNVQFLKLKFSVKSLLEIMQNAKNYYRL